MKMILMVSKDIDYTNRISEQVNSDELTLITVSEMQGALNIIKNEKIDVVIVDLIPDVLTDDLLLVIQNKYPKVIRLSIAESHSGSDNYLPKQMNHSQVHCDKTMNINELIQLIKKVLEIDAKVKNKELVNIVSTFKHIPTLPQIFYDLNQLIQDNASMEDISNKLEEDPAIAANILKMANAAFYNAKTGSIRQAIMYIGLINVKNIIVSNAVFGKGTLDSKTRELHWEHSRITNRILNAMYVELLGRKLNNNISSVGLLHDIGNIVLMSNLPGKFHEIDQRVTLNENENFNDVEKEIIGFEHGALGGYLLDLWGLPFPIIEASLFHHCPMSSDIINKELVMAVHLSSHYAWKAVNTKKYIDALNEDVFQALEINPLHFDVFFQNLLKKL